MDFFLFMKGFLGLKNLLNLWNVNLNWNQIGKEIISQHQLPTEIIPPFEGRSGINHARHHGKNIQVRVVDGTKEKVKLTMPFMTIFDLDDFIDEEVKEQIKREGHDLDKIIQEALIDGGKPKELVNIKKGHKTYFVAIV